MTEHIIVIHAPYSFDPGEWDSPEHAEAIGCKAQLLEQADAIGMGDMLHEAVVLWDAKMVDVLLANASQWTSEPPTEPGWYPAAPIKSYGMPGSINLGSPRPVELVASDSAYREATGLDSPTMTRDGKHPKLWWWCHQPLAWPDPPGGA